MAAKFDFKKEYKELYAPKTAPSIVDVPEMLFIAVDGEGDPNTSQAYQDALEVLYGLPIPSDEPTKRLHTRRVLRLCCPTLEGLWEGGGVDVETMTVSDKNTFTWTMLLRQPDFVTEEVFAWAKEVLGKKKKGLDLSGARLITYTEGLCVQLMHIGPYDTEPESVKRMHAFAEEQGYRIDFSPERKHHEIYISDPRRTAPEKLKTVIRHPVAE